MISVMRITVPPRYVWSNWRKNDGLEFHATNNRTTAEHCTTPTKKPADEDSQRAKIGERLRLMSNAISSDPTPSHGTHRGKASSGNHQARRLGNRQHGQTAFKAERRGRRTDQASIHGGPGPKVDVV